MSIAQASGLRAAATAEARRSWSSSLVRWGAGGVAGRGVSSADEPALSAKTEHGSAPIATTAAAFADGYGISIARDVCKLGAVSFVPRAPALGVVCAVYRRLLGMLP